MVYLIFLKGDTKNEKSQKNFKFGYCFEHASVF